MKTVYKNQGTVMSRNVERKTYDWSCLEDSSFKEVTDGNREECHRKTHLDIIWFLKFFTNSRECCGTFEDFSSTFPKRHF